MQCNVKISRTCVSYFRVHCVPVYVTHNLEVNFNFASSFFDAMVSQEITRVKKHDLYKYRVFNLKVDRILIWVIYLLRFTTCYITQLVCIYSKCWKWCPFISVHLSTRYIMFLATFLNVLSFISSMARVIFIFKILNFSKKLCLQWA